MLYEYIIPLMILAAVAAAAFIIIRAVFMSRTFTQMDIIISADDEAEEVERGIVTARFVTEKYFVNAAIYVSGEDDGYIEYLCKTYGVLRKE